MRVRLPSSTYLNVCGALPAALVRTTRIVRVGVTRAPGCGETIRRCGVGAGVAGAEE
jgi:hypothetical protein